MIRHLLVTNDFPPKIGGIQSYLWELWRRLPPDDVTVLTTPQKEASRFDSAQAFHILRSREPVLLPNPVLLRQVRDLARAVDAQVVVLDPAIPLGLIGPRLGIPYVPILHGAEVTVPARLPGAARLLSQVLSRASLIISAGGYPESEARKLVADLPRVVQVPPGVDTARFIPLDAESRARVRASLDLPEDCPLVISVSRLVPRKGMDVLIDAAARLRDDPRFPGARVVIAGEGRDRQRLEKVIRRTGAPVSLLGRVPPGDLPDLYAAGDVFALCCRSRWGGLEQEGFGIVFLEAAAAGLPSVAGDSGGSAEAVVDGETGVVIADPRDAGLVAGALAGILDDPSLAHAQGRAARARAKAEFDYDLLAGRLRGALDSLAA